MKVEKVKNPTGTFRYQRVKIMKHSVIDLADIPKHTGTIVLHGKGFLVSYPSVPNYLLENIEALEKGEKNPCAQTIDEHQVQANRIRQDEARGLNSILFVLPDQMFFSSDLTNINAAPLPSDQKIKINMREIKASSLIGGKKVDQILFPGHFDLRIIISEEKKDDLQGEQADDDDFLSYFAGAASVTDQKEDESGA